MDRTAAKNDLLQQLQKEILSLQGLKAVSGQSRLHTGLGPLETAFPNHTFPTGAVHEFISLQPEAAAATSGFMAGLLGLLMQKGACLWISNHRTLFPPALKTFGIEPDRIIFLDLVKEKDVLWAIEEALKCEPLAAVVGELRDLSFTASRRLQLAVEQSRVTGFIHRHQPKSGQTVACISRWKITPLASVPEAGLPGVGFPRWQVQLLKIRNGKPGSWQVEWSADRFRHIPGQQAVTATTQQQTG